MSCLLFKDIKIIVLNKILEERKNSVILIQHYWKSKYIYFTKSLVYKSKLELRKFNIIKQIMLNRINAEKKICFYTKNYLYRIKVLKLIQKLKLCYSIIPSIQNTKNIKISIKLGKEKEKLYLLKYCPIRKQFVFDIPRNLIKKFYYKFFFIIDNVKTIDLKYEFIRTKNDYVNIINFRKIQDNEFFLEKEYDKEIEAYYSTNISSETNSKVSISTIDSFDINSRKKIVSILDLGLKKFPSQNIRINYPISILKCRNYNREKSFKKVSFGKIEFSK